MVCCWFYIRDINMMDEKDKKFNGILIKKSNKKDVKVIEKLIDKEEKTLHEELMEGFKKEQEELKDEEMDAKIHSWNPNKGYWRN